MKKMVSTLLAVVLLTAQIGGFAKDYSEYPQRFWDVPKDHWAFAYISELVDKNVLAGYEDGSYRPEETVTRAEWSKMMVVASGKQEVRLENNGAYAVDYNANDWYYGYVNAVVDYMNFYNESDGVYFKPDQAVSREDVTVSLVKLKGYDTENVDYSVIMSFNDHDSISNSIKKYVAVGVEKGLISGYEDNTFRGQDTLTRAEAATLLCRAFQMGNDNKTNNNPDVVNPDENTNSTSNTSDDTQNDTNTADNGNTAVSSTDENQEDKKEYKVETLAKADVTTIHGYVQDNDDNLYYYDEISNDIIKVNMITKKSEVLINTKDISVNLDDIEYNDFKFNHLFYDNYSNNLIVCGNCKTTDPLIENSTLYDCMIELPECKLIKHNYDSNSLWSRWFYFVNTTDDGDYLVLTSYESVPHIKLVNRETFEMSEIRSSGAISLKMIDGNLYQLASDAIVNISTDEKIVEKAFNAVGVSNDAAFYIAVGDMIVITSLDGKTQKVININEDIAIKDILKIDLYRIGNKLLVSSNDDIVFYDDNAKAFRMISKND